MVPGTGTVLNVATVLIGSALGVALGDRLPERTRTVLTDGLGLVTLLVAGRQAAAVADPSLTDALGRSTVLVLLAAVLLGGLAGSLLRLEERLAALGGTVRRRLRGTADDRPTGDSRQAGTTFVEGFVAASLVFCVGPLTILGSLQDGLGEGIELLAVKSALDGFAALAFASSLGWGVAASALVVAGYQGALTVGAVTTRGALSDPAVAALTAVGGLLLVGVALRLLRVRAVPVADLLPALVLAPLLTVIVQAVR